MTRTTPPDGDDLPPSCRFVLHVLEEHGGSLTRQKLLKETGLPERTLQRALDTLENGNYLLRSRETEDLRQVVCQTGTDAHS